MVCATCGTEPAAGARFCTECGAPLAQPCAGCGLANPAAAKFCAGCGAQLGRAPEAAREPAPPSRPGVVAAEPAAVAERRLVTVLFADLVGFTALSESRDPEEVRDLLSRYFELSRGLIERYGGTVEKFIGDAVMAVWGAPAATEDDAERAVRAGLDLVSAVASLGAEVGAPALRARAGVLTGDAAVTVGAVGEGMVAGDLVNTAARIQAAADPGTVLVGEATVRAAGAAIAFGARDPVALKGKAQPVPVWQALRVVSQRRGVGRTDRAEPPFVGRDAELRLLQELLDATGRAQRVHLVSVTGIPGIGKSRLAWEFLKYVDGLASAVFWHQGRSPAYGEGITFWALGEMVRMRAGINEADDPIEARQKLTASVAEFVTDPGERRWIEQGLAHLLGLAEAAGRDREELFSAWRTFFERIAEQATTVLVFEDLQWADPGLIDFIESIVDWSRSRPLMVVTLARPELLERRPNWGAGQRQFTALQLAPLTEEAMGALLRGFVSDLPESVVTQVLARAEGVPLYAVETIRMLVDRGQLAERDGVLSVAGPLGALDIPDTLHALIASRLDGVPAAERALLQDASVLGQSFAAPALAAVTGRDAGGLAGPLRDLVRRELLALDTNPRSPERGQYGFVQGLIREVAYGTLARPERRVRHLAAARYFEGLEDEELAPVVATHYAAAHTVSPPGPERDALAAQAREWLARAGRRALDLGSPEPALVHLEQALALASDAGTRAMLLDLAGEAAYRASATQAALEHLEAAAAAHREAGDGDAAAVSAARLADALSQSDQVGLAVERAERALEDLGPDGGTRARADLAATLARLLSNSGRPERALVWAEIACTEAERLDDSALLGRAVGAKASAFYHLGRHREAAILARGRAELADGGGSLLERAQAKSALAGCLLDDDPRQARALYADAAALAARGGHRFRETGSLLNAAESAILLGQWPEARQALASLGQRELVASDQGFVACCEAVLTALSGDGPPADARLAAAGELERSEDVSMRATYVRATALVRLAAGDLEEANRRAAQVVAAEPSGQNTPGALAVQLHSALWLRDPDRARAAIQAMQGFRGRWMAALRLTGEAGLAALEARLEAAAAGYARALDAWRAIDSPLDLALCAVDRAVLRDRTRPPGTDDDEGRTILTRLGARPLLERLDQAAAVTAAAG